MSSGANPHERVFGERGEGVVRLIGEDVAVSEKENTRTAQGFTAQIPAAVEEFPGDLKGNQGLARTSRKGEQDTRLVLSDRIQHAVDGDVSKVPLAQGAALVVEWHGSEAVAPRIRFGKGHRPEFVRGRVGRQLAFLTGLHVDAVDALTVRRVGVADGQLAGVVLRLRHAFCQCFVPGFGFDDRQLATAIDQHVIGGECPAAPTVALDAARRDRILAEDLAVLHNAPARRYERGVDVLASCLGFVHGCRAYSSPVKA